MARQCHCASSCCWEMRPAMNWGIAGTIRDKTEKTLRSYADDQKIYLFRLSPQGPPRHAVSRTGGNAISTFGAQQRRWKGARHTIAVMREISRVYPGDPCHRGGICRHSGRRPRKGIGPIASQPARSSPATSHRGPGDRRKYGACRVGRVDRQRDRSQSAARCHSLGSGQGPHRSFHPSARCPAADQQAPA